MTDVSTSLTGTVAISTKALAITQRMALYEQRAITLSTTGGNFPSGNYRLQVTFGPRTVALAALTASGADVSGTLNLSTTQMEALFSVLPVDRLACQAVLWDATGKVRWGRSRVDVWRNEYTDETAAPVPVRNSVEQGVADITSGAQTVTVALTGVSVVDTASIAASVIVPSGQNNLFVVSVAPVSSGGYITSIVFTLSAATAATGYKLSWMVAQ
jgi:hypothetical protein